MKQRTNVTADMREVSEMSEGMSELKVRDGDFDRQALGISRRELARRCGCSEKLVRRLEGRGYFDHAFAGDDTLEPSIAEPLLEAHLGRNRRPAPQPGERRAEAATLADNLLWRFLHRLEEREDIEAQRDTPDPDAGPDDKPWKEEQTVAEVAEAMSVSPAAIVAWLRAGGPYATEGTDWRTGAGFTIRLYHMIEFANVVRMVQALAGDAESARLLHVNR